MPVFAGNEVPVAVSIPVTGESIPVAGTVVSYDEEGDIYPISHLQAGYPPFGVVSERPVLILDTDLDMSTVPVVVQGVTRVRVTDIGGPISRGTILGSSDVLGVAQKADIKDDDVFAIALEEVFFGGQDESVVLVEVNVAKARLIQEERRAELEDTLITDPNSSGRTTGEIIATTARIAVAMIVAGVSLAFILYTFRSIWVNGVTAVGRNPRAQKSVMLMSIGSSVLLLVLAVFMVVVALAVLVVGV